MRPSKKSNRDKRSNATRAKDSKSGHLTRLSDDLMVGRRVSKTELGPNKDLDKRSIVLVP